jgi:uncharacterized membrane protein YebE (DUF533 family)
MPSIYDQIIHATANSRAAREAYERAAFNLDASSEHEVAYLEILERRAETANDILNGYLDQVPRTKANA